MKMHWTFVLLLLFTGNAFAQEISRGAWLNLDYTYSNHSYAESLMNEKGNFPGIRGELGLGLGSVLGISAGGEYMEGNPFYNGQTFTGTPVQTTTKDYVSDMRALVHIFMGSFALAGGVARREWYDNLVISYRRREIYNYYPVQLTLNRGSFYFRGEYDIWERGTNTSYMSDLGAPHQDVHFTQSSGSGWGVEVGCEIPTSAGFASRIFVMYQQWNVAGSDIQNDGTQNLQEPTNSTTTISGGLGIGF